MKGFLVYAVGSEKHIELIKNSSRIARYGKKDFKPISLQIPKFKNLPLVYCSYFCRGYEGVEGFPGVIFETENPIAYASPVDTFELMREGIYIPGHERFIFSSVDEMLKKYPSCMDFKKDFRDFFKNLNPQDVFPNKSKAEAEKAHKGNYVNFNEWMCEQFNEITFNGQVNAKVIDVYHNLDELKEKLNFL